MDIILTQRDESILKCLVMCVRVLSLRQMAVHWWNGEMAIRYAVTYSCKYKSGDQWKDCTSYGPVEMALISTAFTLANLWISMQGRQTKPSPTIE